MCVCVCVRACLHARCANAQARVGGCVLLTCGCGPEFCFGRVGVYYLNESEKCLAFRYRSLSGNMLMALPVVAITNERKTIPLVTEAMVSLKKIIVTLNN